MINITLLKISPYTSPLPNNHHQLSLENVRPYAGIMSMGRVQKLSRLPANQIAIRSFCVKAQKSMASEAKTETQPNDSEKEGVGENANNREEKSTKLPPPPEKPLPGDCCGSGCVRCVWDVYYEELDDYNKLYKS